MLGANVWAGLACVVVPVVIPVPVQGTPLQIAGINGANGLVTGPGAAWLAERSWSFDIVPPGTIMPVIGCSADTEKALPYGPARVYRTCGMRWPPVEPRAPPNSIDSVS